MTTRSSYAIACAGIALIVVSMAWTYAQTGETAVSDRAAEDYLHAVEEVHRLVDLQVQGQATVEEVAAAKAQLAAMESRIEASDWRSGLVRGSLFWIGIAILVAVIIRERTRA